MIIRTVEIENIGPFRGNAVFDLETASRRNGDIKPVVLFGGKNGAGKTNILDAIKIGLYGRRIFDRKFSESDYKQAIWERIHKHINVDFARVKISLGVVRQGLPHDIVVERLWKKKGESLVERLNLEVDGEKPEGLKNEQWQDYIDELLSPNLAHLFFFDGEKIEELASDDENQASRALADAVQSLFGINLVNQLKSDLVVLEKQVGDRGSSQVDKDVANLHRQLIAKKDEYKRLCDKLQNCCDKIDREKTKQIRTEEELRKRGGEYADRREALQGRVEATKAELKAVEQQFFKACDDLLPFLFCRELVKELKVDLEGYDEAETKRRAGRFLSAKAVNFKKAFQPQNLVKVDDTLDSKQQKALQSYVEGLLLDFTEKEGAGKERVIDLSQGDFALLLSQCDILESKTRKDAKEFELALRNVNTERLDAEKELEKAPKQEDLISFFDELRIISERLGTFQGEEHQIREQEKLLLKEISDLERKLKKLADTFVDDSEASLVLRRSTGVREVLERYAEELSRKKMSDLSAEVLQIFNSIARKKEMLQNIIIDPSNFSINVVHSTYGLIPKQRLSAGERQMLAVSVLWGLMRLSGKSLPIVIDTPLGRLDMEHRDSLVTKYLTSASHQVIVLSTDSEITESYYSRLKPHISRKYLLDYDSKGGFTKVQEGYFWS